MRALLVTLAACGGAAGGGYTLTPDPAEPAAPVPSAQPTPPRLVVHEWGTFTSFSGADGVPVGFRPNNEDLPNFVYFANNPYAKAGRLQRHGTVSMETPVVYFYTDRETPVRVTVDFPRGWITEWYPFAAGSPGVGSRDEKRGGQTIRWEARLTPDGSARFPVEKGDRASENPYYHARETDAVPLQVEIPVKSKEDEDRYLALRGGSVLQREKFLFYRGVGTFPPPVAVKALGGGRVSVRNESGGRAAGLVLLTVRDGKIGFRALPDIDAGASAESVVPELGARREDLADVVVKALTAAGLYEREARAMVKTWDAAWFREEGTRLLYLVPRAKTDELLPLTVDPKPAEVVRVLVGRHDFITPEQEAEADRQVKRVRAAQAELDAAQKELGKLGRFAWEAREQAERRLTPTAAPVKD